MNGTSFNWEHFQYEEKRAKGGMIGMTVWVTVWGKKERERGTISMIQMEKEPGKRTSRKSMEKAQKRLIMFKAERSQNIFRDIYVYNIIQHT